MRHLIISLSIILSLFTASAQNFNQDKAIQEISDAAASIKTLQCDFTQVKTLKMLGDKMVAKGRMCCQQPDKLRWEYTTPYTYIFILNNNKVLLKKGHRDDVIDVNQNKMFREIARIMMNSVLGKCLTDKKDFKTTVQADGNSYLATMIPQKKELRQMFTRIVLVYDKTLKMVTEVRLYEKNGDNTIITLTNFNKNCPIDASEFKID